MLTLSENLKIGLKTPLKMVESPPYPLGTGSETEARQSPDRLIRITFHNGLRRGTKGRSKRLFRAWPAPLSFPDRSIPIVFR